MRFLLFLLSMPCLCFSQTREISGVYKGTMPERYITLNPDSTFNYSTKEIHPVFARWEEFNENGKWSMNGDTVILNPDLDKKEYIEYDFSEERQGASDSIWLSFYHMKRYYDVNGTIRRIDTFHIERTDFAFNEFNRKKIRRIASMRSSRCAFAGFVPKEIITNDYVVPVAKPKDGVKSILIGCYELRGIKEIKIDDSVTHFRFNVYSNYYDGGQLRQMKLLVRKDHKMLFSWQKTNGKFRKHSVFEGAYLKRQKGIELAAIGIR